MRTSTICNLKEESFAWIFMTSTSTSFLKPGEGSFCSSCWLEYTATSFRNKDNP